MDGPTFKIERILKGEQRTDRFDVDAKLVADEDEPAQISGIQVLSVAIGAWRGRPSADLQSSARRSHDISGNPAMF